jgi:hypothetical protein
MSRKMWILLLLGSLLLVNSACTPDSASNTSAADTGDVEETDAVMETELALEDAPTDAPESAETMAPSPTAMTILWEDDFSDVNSGWERYRQFDGVLDYGDGEEVYQMLVSVEGNLFWVMKDEDLFDVTMSIEAWQVDGPEGSLYGLMCRYDPDAMDGYFFLISSQGEAGIGTFNFGFEPIPGGELTAFDAIQTGLDAKNTITASCTDEALTLSVNGEVLLNLPATGLTGGDIGMAVATPMGAGADVYFDNLIIYEP